MTIVVPRDYHALPQIRQERISWMTPQDAERQDIRALRVGILNIMPFGKDYEFNLLHPLGLSILQVEPVWIRMESHEYKTGDVEHMEDLYITYEQACQGEPLDGLIVTGAPVEKIHFEEVRYWPEISQILQDARANCPSTLGICWGGFALAYLTGVEKLTYEKKLFGVFPLQNLDIGHVITGEMDDLFWCPQSRHAGIDDAEMEAAQREGRLALLAYGEEAGYSIFETPDHRFVMHTGHPEYNARRLVYEAERDQQAGEVPPPANFDLSNPINRWRGHRNTFFTQWLKYCYQQVSMQTPPS
jgi:homoserine O-succinyltransferase